jgi:hypothetical protein
VARRVCSFQRGHCPPSESIASLTVWCAASSANKMPRSGCKTNQSAHSSYASVKAPSSHVRKLTSTAA